MTCEDTDSVADQTQYREVTRASILPQIEQFFSSK